MPIAYGANLLRKGVTEGYMWICESQHVDRYLHERLDFFKRAIPMAIENSAIAQFIAATFLHYACI